MSIVTKITAVKVIRFYDLENENSDSFTFDEFSYGDADLTLVGPSRLIVELEQRPEDGDWVDLIEELKTIPEGTLVAF